jgi:hypothetical protein
MTTLCLLQSVFRAVNYSCAMRLSPLRLLLRSFWRPGPPGIVATVQSLEHKTSKATAPLTWNASPPPVMLPFRAYVMQKHRRLQLSDRERH